MPYNQGQKKEVPVSEIIRQGFICGVYSFLGRCGFEISLRDGSPHERIESPYSYEKCLDFYLRNQEKRVYEVGCLVCDTPVWVMERPENIFICKDCS